MTWGESRTVVRDCWALQFDKKKLHKPFWNRTTDQRKEQKVEKKECARKNS
jgi:hypothetical protein